MGETDTLFSLTELNTNSDEDGDIQNEEESTSVPSQYRVEKEKSLSLQRTYILHMCSSRGITNRLFMGLSNFTTVVYDLETLSQLACLSGHNSTLTGIKICCDEDDLVYSASLDGTVKLWDVRIKNSLVRTFKDASEGDSKLKPLTSFDVSPQKTLIAAGTELFDGDAFMLFWDARSTKLMGGYWESHTDDITDVCFHTSNKDWLASGSTDGLLNVFDISESTEDDALLYSMNTHSSVDKVQWIVCPDEVDAISCITHTQDIQLWKTDSGTPYMNYSRNDITKTMLRKSAGNCYLIDVLPNQCDSEVSVLAGSTAGRGECLKLLSVCNKKLKLNGVFNGNKQIVRSCCSAKGTDVLVTGGESGFFTVWKSRPQVLNDSSNLKAKTKFQNSHVHKKPY